ncbi:JHBP domain containing protein, partial [Asbolus verrucosus]
SSFKKCNRKQADFNKCLATAVQDAINQLNDPIPEIGLPSLEPLQMPTLTIPAGKTAVLFEQNYKNFIMRGLSKGKSKFQRQNRQRGMLSPRKNVTFFLTFKLEEFEKRGKRYFKVVDTKLIQEPEGIKFEFDNLVRNDVNLGSEDDTDINKIFNDNWRPIYYDIRASSFRKCNRTQDDFNQCLATALQDALSQLTKPFPEVGLPSLDPLETPALTVPAGSSILQFPQVYTNFNIYGLTNGNVTKFDFNFDNKTMYIEIIFPEIRAEFEYDYNGKILLVPIKGKGPGKISA